MTCSQGVQKWAINQKKETTGRLFKKQNTKHGYQCLPREIILTFSSIEVKMSAWLGIKENVMGSPEWLETSSGDKEHPCKISQQHGKLLWLSPLSSLSPGRQLSVWMHRVAWASGTLQSKWCLTPPSLSHPFSAFRFLSRIQCRAHPSAAADTLAC